MTHFVAVSGYEAFYGPFTEADANAFAAAYGRYYPHEPRVTVCTFAADSFNYIQDVTTKTVRGPLSIIECAQLIAASAGRWRPIHIQTID